jgi:periplasmic protein TonB
MGKKPLIASIALHLTAVGAPLLYSGLWADRITQPYATVWVEVSGTPGESALPKQKPAPKAFKAKVAKRVTDRISQAKSAPIPVAETLEAPAGNGPEGEPVPAPGFLISAMPELVSEVRVPYPPSAKQRGISGAVLMDLLIDDAGKVRKAALINGPDPELNDSALRAIREFRFKPALQEGRAVAARIRYTYRFVLAN